MRWLGAVLVLAACSGKHGPARDSEDAARHAAAPPPQQPMDARAMMQRLYDAAAAARPARTTPLTPADPTACCRGCAPDPSLWTAPAWTALGFAVTEPHPFSYQYIAGAGGAFTVRAHGDLDCDGVWSTFEVHSDGGGVYRGE